MIQLGSTSFLEDARILVTGGTGSLGSRVVRTLLSKTVLSTVLVYSRDEYKQAEMQQRLPADAAKRVRFYLGDVADQDRLRRAMDGADYVLHAAALKRVPASESNPFEFVKANILGAESVINAAIDCGVKRVVATGTDKAANAISLYGATKLCAEKLFVSGNFTRNGAPTRFSVVRCGNLIGSRGSVVPFFLEKRKDGVLPITDPRMTRFWITLDQGAALLLNALRDMQGGEIFIPKIPSMQIDDLARVIAPDCRHEVVGFRPGDKLHEVMVAADEARLTLDYPDRYILHPVPPAWAEDWTPPEGGVPCPDDFSYRSDNNSNGLTPETLAKYIAELDLPEARTWAKEKESPLCG